MTTFLGLVPDEVETLAVDFDAKAGDIETLISSLVVRLSTTTWTGPDRDQFQSDWDGPLTSNLRNAAASLRDAAAVARANAEQQRQASA